MTSTQPIHQTSNVVVDERRVRFSPDVPRSYPNRAGTLSELECNAMFYSAQEYRDVMLSIRSTLIELKVGKNPDYELLRGLEQMLTAPYEGTHRREAFFDSFFTTQSLLHQQKHKEEALSQLARTYTEDDQARARRLAKQDEKDAKKVYKEQDTSKSFGVSRTFKKQSKGSRFLRTKSLKLKSVRTSLFAW
ncbi:expressed unknown protein [Seminavis robusta]|uniref:Uncharacterized protein n=1 Tax=Seminavis robusta TaxID=568900 RepID=A0A9N8EFT6_9STRA|nr:expressed unknown protein [Seminavis robusta]|eukprot:Sro1031_g233450.1 n/a (191) ;mRNA; r:24095-24667